MPQDSSKSYLETQEQQAGGSSNPTASPDIRRGSQSPFLLFLCLEVPAPQIAEGRAAAVEQRPHCRVLESLLSE